jgi:hypothetical protein
MLNRPGRGQAGVTDSSHCAAHVVCKWQAYVHGGTSALANVSLPHASTSAHMLCLKPRRRCCTCCEAAAVIYMCHPHAIHSQLVNSKHCSARAASSEVRAHIVCHGLRTRKRQHRPKGHTPRQNRHTAARSTPSASHRTSCQQSTGILRSSHRPSSDVQATAQLHHDMAAT